MGIFDMCKKNVNTKDDFDVAREVAKDVVRALLKSVREDKSTEKLSMIREPSDNPDGMEIKINYTGKGITAPLYGYYITKTLCNIAGLSFKDMINHFKVYDELLPEVSTELNTRTEREVEDGQK